MDKIDYNRILEALKPYGPTPIVTVFIGLAAFTALSANANPIATVLVVFATLGTHIYMQERAATFRKRELEIDFDETLRKDTQQITERFKRRLEQRRNAAEPGLFDEEADD